MQTVAPAPPTPASAPEEAPDWLAPVLRLLHARFDQVVRTTELAERAGVHPAHLSRVFRRVHGCTVGEYQRRLRVARACAALEESDVALASLAYRTGFADQAHFSRRFKEVTGLTPGQYRRRVARRVPRPIGGRRPPP